MGSQLPAWMWQGLKAQRPAAGEVGKMAAGCGGSGAAIPAAGGMGDPSSVGQPHCSFQPFSAARRFAWLITAAAGEGGETWEVVRERRNSLYVKESPQRQIAYKSLLGLPSPCQASGRLCYAIWRRFNIKSQ